MNGTDNRVLAEINVEMRRLARIYAAMTLITLLVVPAAWAAYWMGLVSIDHLAGAVALLILAELGIGRWLDRREQAARERFVAELERLTPIIPPEDRIP